MIFWACFDFPVKRSASSFLDSSMGLRFVFKFQLVVGFYEGAVCFRRQSLCKYERFFLLPVAWKSGHMAIFRYFTFWFF